MVPSDVSHPGPKPPLVLYWLARLWFRVFGWDTEGDVPQAPKGVLIAAPHTTNWDLAHMLAASLVYRYRISWIGKHTLFRFPFGWFMRFLGGVPIDRTSPQGMVKSAAQQLRDAHQLVLAIPPSGSRSRKDHWKSGFYWIAYEAQVPVVCGYLDYTRRRAGLGFAFVPSGDVKADMERVRAFYADKRGKYPENETPVLLKEELEDGQHAGKA